MPVFDDEYYGEDQTYDVNTVIVVQALSAGFNSGDFTKITINDKKVEIQGQMYKNRPRGLHIVILNPANAMVEISQVFDTFTSSDEFHEFIGQKF